MKLPVLAAALMAVSPLAEAATYQVSYEFDVDLGYPNAIPLTVTTIVTADLDTDGNSLINVVNRSLTFSNGFYLAPGEPLTYSPEMDVVSIDQFYTTPTVPTLTLDQSYMDYVFCISQNCLFQFHVSVNNYATGAGGIPVAHVNLGPPSLFFWAEMIEMNRLSVTEMPATTPVPLPAGLPLAVAGLAGLAALRRRSA
ncbi:hypothetical protein [Mangrovicoccus sp. HB161399]|uniref:hypothetical protein n=1 Tax=Mangrovicoccus sp. HB161399 TaxID=2720392 RepID=UPI00155448C3|nr:hypothetical protein [Mangrovicoccus sp. HB161399]